MSKRQSIATFALVACLSASPAMAEEVSDRIVLWLEQQGFTNFEIERTWLGRIKIEAYARGVEREIIINGRTGEILRDFWEVEDEHGGSDVILIPAPAGIGNARGVMPIQKNSSSEDGNQDDDVDDDESSGNSSSASNSDGQDDNGGDDQDDRGGDDNDGQDDSDERDDEDHEDDDDEDDEEDDDEDDEDDDDDSEDDD